MALAAPKSQSGPSIVIPSTGIHFATEQVFSSVGNDSASMVSNDKTRCPSMI